MLIAASVTLYAGVGVTLYWAQDSIIFPRTVNAIPAPDHDSPEGLEYLSFTTPDGALLNGLGFGTHAEANTLVLAFGGNAHDVTGMVRFLRDDVFPNQSVALAGYSYRGYPNALGRPSTGVPSQAALEADAVAQYDALVARVEPAKVVVIGYSLGTAVGTFLATQRKVDHLILAAPFASMVQLAQDRYKVYPAAWMVKHPFRVDVMLGQVSASVTMVYSKADGLIAGSHISRLRKVAPQAAVVALQPPVGHGDVLDHGDIPTLFRKATGVD